MSLPPLNLSTGPAISTATGSTATGSFDFKPSSPGLSTVALIAVLAAGLYFTLRK